MAEKIEPKEVSILTVAEYEDSWYLMFSNGKYENHGIGNVKTLPTALRELANQIEEFEK